MSDVRSIKYSFEVDGGEFLPPIAELKDNFLYGDNISAEKLDVYAKRIAEKVKVAKNPQDKMTIIEDELNGDKLFEFYRPPQGADRSTITIRDESLAALTNLRKGLLKRLANFLEPEDYYLVDRELSPCGVNNILKLDGRYPSNSNVYREFINSLDDVAAKAVTKLLQFDERTPYLIRIKYFDTKYSRALVEYKDNLSNLFEILERDIRKFKLSKILKILADNIRGGIFLTNKGLVMMDICLENCGFDGERGVLFDVEGLCIEGAVINGRPHHQGYYPFGEGYHGSTQVMNSEMTYQFGVCLYNIRQKFVFLVTDSNERAEKSSEVLCEIEELSRKMMGVDGKVEISLEDALRELEDIIKFTEDQENAKK